MVAEEEQRERIIRKKKPYNAAAHDNLHIFSTTVTKFYVWDLNMLFTSLPPLPRLLIRLLIFPGFTVHPDHE